MACRYATNVRMLASLSSASSTRRLATAPGTSSDDASPVTTPPDYAALFPQGMGVGEGGPLRDLRFAWQDGAAHPTPPALFRTLAASL